LNAAQDSTNIGTGTVDIPTQSKRPRGRRGTPQNEAKHGGNMFAELYVESMVIATK
jgi:hypothetical protein